MRRILTFFLSFSVLIGLCGCSSKANKDHVITFFDAFDKTLNLDSGHIVGTVTMVNNKDTSKMHLDIQLDQTKQVECALTLGLTANENHVDDYIDFYIHDGKTYLNNMGTKSQSKAENIGLAEGQKLAAYNPFLSYTDTELASVFTSSKKKEDVYTFTVDPSLLSTYLDELGTVDIAKAEIKATIPDAYITRLQIHIKGKQTVYENTSDFDITIEASLEDINSLKGIDFPEDLDSYPTE